MPFWVFVTAAGRRYVEQHGTDELISVLVQLGREHDEKLELEVPERSDAAAVRAYYSFFSRGIIEVPEDVDGKKLDALHDIFSEMTEVVNKEAGEGMTGLWLIIAGEHQGMLPTQPPGGAGAEAAMGATHADDEPRLDCDSPS